MSTYYEWMVAGRGTSGHGMPMKNLEDSSRGKSVGARNRHVDLLRHAVPALNAQGVSQTSLGQIADDLGISRAALYYYVEDLQDLVFQCYRATCERLTAQIGQAVREGGDEAEIITRFIVAALDPADDDFASLSEVGYLNERQLETILGLYDGLLAQLAGVVAKGVSANRLRPCDSWIVAHTIISMVFWAPISEGWSPAVRTMARTPSAQALSDVVLNGILAPNATVGAMAPVEFDTLLPSSRGLFDKEYLTLARREALMRSASHLFNSKGIDATSLEEIAASVGATKRAILHYFGDKQGLIEQAYKRAYSIFLLIPDSLRRSALPAHEQLASAWVALSEAYLRQELAPLTPRAGLEGLREAARDELQTLSSQLTSQYVAILREAAGASALREFDLGGFLMVVSGAFAWLSRGIFSAEPSDYPRIAREISDLLMLGLLRRTSAPIAS